MLCVFEFAVSLGTAGPGTACSLAVGRCVAGGKVRCDVGSLQFPESASDGSDVLCLSGAGPTEFGVLPRLDLLALRRRGRAGFVISSVSKSVAFSDHDFTEHGEGSVIP